MPTIKLFEIKPGEEKEIPPGVLLCHGTDNRPGHEGGMLILMQLKDGSQIATARILDIKGKPHQG